MADDNPTKIPEMVERVARALADYEWSHCGGADGQMTGVPNWTHWAVKARIAIEPMREPTEAMIEAGLGEIPGGLSPKLSTAEEVISDAWRAMIDAALGQ